MNALLAPAPNTVRVQPLTPAIGSYVEGLDLRALDDQGFADIRDLFLERCMLVFRNQFMSSQDLLAFASRWGKVATTPMLTYLDDAPGVRRLVNFTKAKTHTENWHYDSSFMPAPHAISLLSPEVLPPAGGDTMWCNQYLAYETLSPGMQRMIAGVRGRFVGTRLARAHGHVGDVPSAYHPIVRTHPETGRKALFVGHPDTLPHLEGMTPQESRPLLDYLYAHSTQPDRICRHRWEKGDVLMWDNRCTMHYAVHDYGDAQRDMLRVTIAGTVPC